ncbi:MAG: cell wall hydrolase [Blautia sp.]|nr:cell wall hydrolase [Blautia sp.]
MMKVRMKRWKSHRHKDKTKSTGDTYHSLINVLIVTFAVVILAVSSGIAVRGDKGSVYAAAGEEDNKEQADSTEEQALPTGIAGVVSGVKCTVSGQRMVERIGTSCEQVMVGQRVKKIEDHIADLDVSTSMKNKVNDFDAKSISMAQNPAMMSDEDYDTLLRIVEAEAGTEDVKGRILVANVIMNRVKNSEFPDTVTDVVWQTTNGVPQFSPTYDGRINEVTVSKETKEAVKQVLEGTDYSHGALFFIQKSEAEKHNVSWFEKDLKKLFKYGVHEFYTYPDE